jgi:hypothetical protein
MCIVDCWREEPSQRPDFRYVRSSLRQLQAGLYVKNKKTSHNNNDYNNNNVAHYTICPHLQKAKHF